jgi:hypothetical protein
MTQIKLSGIYIYPIKSAAGISLKTARVETRGFQYDRRWMLVDETGKFLSQRQHPQMALISVLLEGDRLVVKAPNRDPVSIPIGFGLNDPPDELAMPLGFAGRQSEVNRDEVQQRDAQESAASKEIGESSDTVLLKQVPQGATLQRGDRIPVQIWNDICDAISLRDEVNQWFSQFLDTCCQLVYMPENSLRLVDPHYATHNELVSFADGFPFLLISEASLQDLNERLDEPVPMNRFRPNLVVSGCEAFAEDAWRQIRIGSIPFQVAKPCSRCVITMVDQTQGIRGKEPLQTLAQYRRWDGQIWFGQNLIQEKLGMLQVGDSVEIDTFIS